MKAQDNMKKTVLTISAFMGAVILGAMPSHAAEGITLWKEYPAQYYPEKAKIVRIKNFSTIEACHDAMMREINSQHNFKNNIRFFCL